MLSRTEVCPSPLSIQDLQRCTDVEGVRQLFLQLGFVVEQDCSLLSKAALAFSPLDEAAIDRIFLLADQGHLLQSLLFKSKPERNAPRLAARLQTIAEHLLQRGGDYFLVFADAYPFARLTFVDPRRVAINGTRCRVQICKLVVDTRHPTRHDLDMLQACAAHGLTPAQMYRHQCEAFNVHRPARKFCHEYSDLRRCLESRIATANRENRVLRSGTRLRAFTQQFLNRVMFLYFSKRKAGWLAIQDF